MVGIGIDGQRRIADDGVDRHAGGLGFGTDRPGDVGGQGRDLDALDAHVLGTGELQEALDHGVEPADLLADDVGVGAHVGRLRPLLELLAQQLQVDASSR